ncbi:GNAT family N-acetyltransferase [Ornithinibacillus sp. L9]|uniref:GNAT family N-acetyltransferase n=1 Tax=Ornithinibacillus caprae TaxID=2678566 RepID=A0A6N8FGJ8_9BACI|nr:GNAT family N-acetyltransferase [Ornithinibacillus caprae]MUK88690.1 GNAT family N-acetyltransferase [Ornithinibacillus caprae]
MEVREYQSSDEEGWLRCRVLSFLQTAYYDNVLQEKETYENPAIELVAVKDDQLVGLIDVEYEKTERTLCSRGNGLGGMIWHLAVHPDFRRNGIGNKLLAEAEKLAKQKGLNRLEAWTRDDDWVNSWYEKNNFRRVDSYLHVYMDGQNELKNTITSEKPSLYPVQVFAHYTGKETKKIKANYKRVHECICYEKEL